MSQPADKIADAVATGLSYAIGFDSPISAVADYVALLSLSTNWTDAEVAEVGRLIVVRLAERCQRGEMATGIAATLNQACPDSPCTPTAGVG